MTIFRKSKQQLYPQVVFPGTHYTKGNTLSWLNGGFTFSELIDENMNNFDGNIFIGGRLNYEDPVFHEKYEEIPYGLVRRIESRGYQHRKLDEFIGRASGSAESYRIESLHVWSVISRYLSPNLPCEEKYPPSTWEWTIRREFFDHMVSRSTYLLDLAIKERERPDQSSYIIPNITNDNGQRVLPAIVEAAAWLELASSWDEHYRIPSPSMKKNMGLAYMNIVRSKEPGGFPFVQDIFNVGENDNETNAIQKWHRRNWWTGASKGGDDNWKLWATTRWQEEWGAFLNLESSKAEPDYSQIKSIYLSVTKLSTSKS